jgi:hypothetical protein
MMVNLIYLFHSFDTHDIFSTAMTSEYSMKFYLAFHYSFYKSPYLLWSNTSKSDMTRSKFELCELLSSYWLDTTTTACLLIWHLHIRALSIFFYIYKKISLTLELPKIIFIWNIHASRICLNSYSSVIFAYPLFILFLHVAF